MRFYRNGRKPLKVTLDLEGDFHEDIRGKVIRLRNPGPADRNGSLGRRGTYMDGFARAQRGTVGDITAGLPLGRWTEDLARTLKAQLEIVWAENGITGEDAEERRREVDREYREKIAAGELHYAYVPYPYIEWYADNGRVVLELDPSAVTVVEDRAAAPPKEKTAGELVEDGKKRAQAFAGFMAGMVQSLSEENRRAGGDGNVSGVVVR